VGTKDLTEEIMRFLEAAQAEAGGGADAVDKDG
jgi:hypothetical protein